MASASDIPVHFPIATPCNLCEEEDDVNSFCKECHQYLCDRCKRLHAKSPFLKNHTIVPYEEGYKIKSDHGDHSVVCKDHNEIFAVFCRTCTAHICTKCLTSKVHKSHDFTDIKSYAEEVTERIKSKIADTTANNNAMANEMSEIEIQNDEAMKLCEQDIETVRERVATLIDEAKAIELEIIGQLQKRRDDLRQKSQKLKDDIQSAVAKNKRQLTEEENNLQCQSNITVVRFENKAAIALSQIQFSFSKPQVDISGRIRFCPGNMDLTCLKDMIGKVGPYTTFDFGDVNEPVPTKVMQKSVRLRDKLSIVKQFKVPGKYFYGITFPSHVWGICVRYDDVICTGISRTSQKYALLLWNDSGEIIKTMCEKLNITPHNIVSITDNIFISASSSILQVSMETGEVTEFAEVGSGIAGGMLVTSDNCVLANVHNNSKRPILQKFSMKGNLVHEIDLTSTLKDSETRCLSNIASYIDGMLLIKYKERILKLDNKYKLIEEIRLKESWETSFLESDKYGHIICANRKGDIFLMDGSGQLVQQYHVDLVDNDEVLCMCVDTRNRLCMGTMNGYVIIASYTQQE